VLDIVAHLIAQAALFVGQMLVEVVEVKARFHRGDIVNHQSKPSHLTTPKNRH
jgi:hypothetical protein